MANLIPVNKSPISKKINSDSFFGKKTKIGKSESVKAKTKGSSLKNEFILIRKKVIKIDKLLNAFIKFQKKNQEGTRREKELGKRSDRESKLEKKKDKVGAISFPSLPVGGNFLESIKRFLFFTFLNIALPKLLELLPKLRELGKAIAPATKFLLDIAGGVGKGLLSGLVNFIDWGYKIRDNTEKTIKQIGGDKAAKDFNEFNKRLNTFIDLSILAGLTALDVGLDAERFRKKQLKDQQKAKGRKPQVTEGRGGQKPIGRPKVTTGAGGKAGAGPVTQGRGGKPLSKFSKFKSGPFAKFAGPIGKFLGAATPFLGAGIGAADAAARFSSGDKVGGALASASSALDAFSGVAAITGVGIPLAGIATGISIGIDIVLLVRDLIKVMLPGVPMFRNGGRIRLFAQGGRIGTPGRTIKVQRKTLGARPSAKPEIKPGKDVGGKNQILKLFPDPSSENKQQTVSASPWWSKIFGSGQNASSSSGKAPNPYKALKGTAEILGKIPGDIGRLMSAGAAIPLGQKPDRDIGRGFGSFVGKITQDIIDNNVNLSFGDIMKSISGFANGGDIRNQNIMKNNDIGYQVGQVVEKAIGSMISSKVNEAVSSIQREIASIGKPPEGETTLPGGDAGNILVSSDQPDFWLLATAALFENSDPQGAADVAQAIYNRVSMPGDPWHVDGSIRKTILNPGQFQPVRDYGGTSAWAKINNKDSAISFIKGQGKTQAQLESVASALLDTTRQRSARNFVGPRDSFRSISYERENNHLADDTEVKRAGHVFGFEPRGATISAFRQGKLTPAEINKEIVKGDVQYTVGANGEVFPLPQGNPTFTPSSYGGTFTSMREGGRQHSAQDIGVDPGSPVLAMKSGVILEAYSSGYGAGGGAVVIQYDDGQIGIYGHVISKIRKGDRVKSGQLIANIKDLGAQTHLHYMRKIGKRYIDPLPILSSSKGNKSNQARLDSKKSAPKPQQTGKILNSFKVGGRTYTEREGGSYTENGKPISKDLYDAVSKNQSQASLAPQKPKTIDVAFNPSYQEGRSGFVSIQPIHHYTFIQQA